MHYPDSLWLCLHFPELPLEVFTKWLPTEEKARPIVVVEKHRVVKRNAVAGDLGIVPGNNMDTAYSLSELITTFERDEQQELSNLSQLAQWAYQFTPNVSIKAPDSLILDVGGCLRLFKGLDALKENIETGLANLGFHPSMGVNRTPLAATCSARSRLPDNAGGSDVKTSLSRLPIEFLEVEEKTIELLKQMGIRHIGNVLDLPMSGLDRRFGVYFSDHIARLIGSKPDPRKFIDPKPRFHNEITFLEDVSDTSALAFPINRLVGELAGFLHVRQLHTDHLVWKLSHRSHGHKPFSIYLANPENDKNIFLALTQLKLDRIDDVKEVDCISLTVNRFLPAKQASGDLFQGTRFQQKDNRNADKLIDMLDARLGHDVCFGLSVANDHRPEKATCIVRSGQRVDSPTVFDDSDNNPRPVFLLNAPRTLNTIDGYPCLGGKLELLKGPERIDFGWWDESSIDKPIARDYYVARQKSGSLFWIFDSKRQGASQWYLHGIFS